MKEKNRETNRKDEEGYAKAGFVGNGGGWWVEVRGGCGKFNPTVVLNPKLLFFIIFIFQTSNH